MWSFHRVTRKAFYGPMCRRIRLSGKIYCRTKIRGLPLESQCLISIVPHWKNPALSWSGPNRASLQGAVPFCPHRRSLFLAELWLALHCCTFKRTNFPIFLGWWWVLPPINSFPRSFRVLCSLSNVILAPGWTARSPWLLEHMHPTEEFPLYRSMFYPSPPYPVGISERLESQSWRLLTPLAEKMLPPSGVPMNAAASQQSSLWSDSAPSFIVLNNVWFLLLPFLIDM